MLLPRFDFEAPDSIQAGCSLMAQAGDQARVLAGGTDLLVKMKRGAIPAPKLIVSLGRIVSLEEIQDLPDGLRLGARATMARIAADPAIRARWQALAEGAGSVGGPIIRNRATVGGNIVHARPCADTLPPLIALGATLRLESTRGTRCVDLDGFVHAPGQCAIGTDEILETVLLPAPAPNQGSHYFEVTRRAAMDVTIVGCAARVVLDSNRKCIDQARLVFSSVAPVPLRAAKAEELLTGQAPSVALVDAAAVEAQRQAPTIGDHRAPRDYRTHLVAVTARRALSCAIERAGGRIR